MAQTKKQPAYLQVYHFLRDSIIKENYKFGEKLPSKRAMADQTGTSVITIEHAYSILEEEGFIEARERSGFFVTYASEFVLANSPASDTRTLQKRKEKGKQTDSITTEDPVANEEEILASFPFNTYAKTMRHVLTEYGDEILKKSPNSGTLMLRNAICLYLARTRKIDVYPTQILIGSGSEALYGLIAQYIGRKKTIALEDPSYDQIRKVYEAHGLKPEFLTMGPEGITTEALNQSKASVLHVTPFHSYPSGITATASKRHEYIRWAKERDGLIIEDDFDSEFSVSTKTEDTLFSQEPEKNVIYINSFSRTIAPSTRVGYMVLPEELAADFTKKLGFYSCTVPVFDQYVIAEFIQSGEFERHINRVRRNLRKKRN